ncbi:MAG: transporter [Pseudomonas sp.]|nr:transporter [Pseudomonas sp.]
MKVGNNEQHIFPIISDPANFDARSGSWIERMVFNHRLVVLLLCLAATLFLGYHATSLQLNASFERVIPSSNPYIQNYLKNRAQLPGLGNNIRVVVENTQGDIFDPQYLSVLREVNDRLYLITGTDRAWMRSLWMPLVRWRQITEDGIAGGPVMPDNYDGSPKSIENLRQNIDRAGLLGTLVANDQHSSMIVAPLMDTVAETGKPLDYAAYSDELEKQLRSLQNDKIKIHIVGFAKLTGDLIAGLREIILYFALSTLIAGLCVYAYTRCLRSTAMLVITSILGVSWMLGLMQLTGFTLDPYSILGPFLIFAIGLSHGAQKMNGILQDIGQGTHRYVAARYTFRRLFFTGLTALLVNIIGFAVLMVIDIPVIRDLAITTSLGVTVLVFTKLILIPVVLSYIGVGKKAAAIALRKDQMGKDETQSIGALWHFLVSFTERRRAIMAIGVALMLAVVAFIVRVDLKVGDLDAGAPELRANSRYNQDIGFINKHFGLSSDQFAVVVKTEADGCRNFQNLLQMRRLGWELDQVPGVQTTQSLADLVQMMTGGMFEGNGKWFTVSRDQRITDTAMSSASIADPGATNIECSITPVVAYLSDHKADTLTRVMKKVEAFAAENDNDKIQFLPAAGSAGIEAVTNIVVERSFWNMHFLLYGAVTLLCLLIFRSWRAALVALIPLMLTSILCETLMVWLGIGVKVATLPVIALGVGVGVDYALYLLSVQLMLQRNGYSLKEAYRGALHFTGRVVALIGITMAAGVMTWIFSPIKFQADMGVLLTFMFLWNMIGALILIPALSHFLLGNVSQAKTGSVAVSEREVVAPAKTEQAVRRCEVPSVL